MTTVRKPPILFVDDEPEMLYSLKGWLRTEFELFTAESGQQALKILAQQPIEVVVTDQRMPEMTGTELLRHVRAAYPDAIRIVFTGYADIRAVIEAINTGGLFRYITKPWDPDELIAVLHEAVAAYQRIVERRRLLADVRDYVLRAQQMAGTPHDGAAAGVDHAALNAAGGELLDRLDKTLAAQPPGSAGH